MANLFNKYIYQTYKSIVGIGQSGTSGLTTNLEPLTDGEGKELPIRVSETEVELTGDTNTTKNLSITAYGPVIDDQGNWVGPTSGISGSSGTSGTSGVNGSSGVAGTSGTSGTSATSGTSGQNGQAGTSGTSGQNGQNGTSGTSGQNGTSGANGTSGTSGISQPGTPGTSGTSGTSGVSNNGTSGTSGVNGVSSSIFNYQAKTGDTTGDPGSGHIIWNSATQQSATSINVSELEQGNTNIDIFLGNLVVGSVITIQDKAIHTNYQTWTITSKTDNSTYWTYGVSLVTSTHSFLNNDQILFIVVATPSGTSGTSGVNGTSGTNGSSGTNGQNGSSGTNGTNGSSGTSGVSGSSGTTGTSGTSGQTGSSGTSGQNGSSGTSGTAGTSGTTPSGTITTSGPNTIANVWSGTQAQYTALGSYSATTLYFIE